MSERPPSYASLLPFVFIRPFSFCNSVRPPHRCVTLFPSREDSLDGPQAVLDCETASLASGHVSLTTPGSKTDTRRGHGEGGILSRWNIKVRDEFAERMPVFSRADTRIAYRYQQNRARRGSARPGEAEWRETKRSSIKSTGRSRPVRGFQLFRCDILLASRRLTLFFHPLTFLSTSGR
jgi:hypothetical protein